MAKSAMLMTEKVSVNPYFLFLESFSFSRGFLYCYKFQITCGRKYAFNYFALV